MAINLQQTSEWIDSDNGNGGDFLPNATEEVRYRFTITNTDSVAVNNIVVTSSLATLSGLTADGDVFDGTLESGESVVLLGSYLLNQMDIDQGEIRSTASLTGTTGGTPITAVEADEDVLPLTRTFGLDVNKIPGAINDIDSNGPDAGDQVLYSYTVSNNGNTRLFDVNLVDDNGTPNDTSDDVTIVLSGLTDEDGNGEANDLGVGVTATGSYIGVLSQDAVDSGRLENFATATATNTVDSLDPFDTTEEQTTSARVRIQRTPRIEVVKTASDVIDSNGDGTDSAGDTIDYSYAVTNTGNISLLNVSLVDDNGTPGDTSDDVVITPLTGLTDLDNDGNADDLAVGATATGSYTATVTQDILNAGQVTNIVEAEGTGTNRQTVTDRDDATVTTDGRPAIDVTKAIAPGTVIEAAGDEIVYNYTMTNTGNVSLLNVTLIDDNGTPGDTSDDVSVSPLTGLSDLDGDGDADDLAVGDTATGSYTGIVTQAAVDAGSLTNIVVGTGTSPDGEEVNDDDDATIDILADPDIDVTKAIAPGTVVTQAGDPIVYNYTMTNTGNVSLLNVTLIDDNGTPGDTSDDVSVSPLTGLSDLDGDGDADDLAVGDTATGSYTGVLTQAAVDAGSLTNIVVGTGTSPDGEEVQDDDDATISVDPNPGIEITKTAEIIETNGNAIAEVGEDITYTYVLTNTGNVSLNNVQLVDDNATPGDLTDDVTATALLAEANQGVLTILQNDPASGIANDLIDADGDGQLDDLAVGGSVTATYTVPVTQAMIDQAMANGNQLTNIVVGEGTPPGSDDPITDDDQETVVTLVPDPGIELTKFTSATAFSDPAALEVPADVTEAIEIAAGDDVYWIYAVENTGNVTFQPDQIVITDDNGTPDDASDDAAIAPILIASTDDGNGRLDVGETWYYQAQGIAQDLSFEFDFDTEQSFNAGDDAATLNGFYGAYDLSISTPLVRGSEEAGNRAMIFDTANPTGEDFDLGTPHGSVGKGQGAGAGAGNDKALGNVLIISEDGDSSDPDDNADGGVLQFDWASNPVRLTEVGLLDIDRAEDVSISTGKDGSGIGTYAAQDLGDNSHQSVALGGEWADQLAVNFEHSGAVSGLKGVGFYQNTATVTAVFNGETLTDDAVSFYTNSIAEIGRTSPADPAATSPVLSTGTDPQDILFVTGSPDNVMDQALQARLTAQGFNVMVQDDDQVQASDADEKELVLISESVFSSSVGAKFTDSDVAVMTWESYLYDDLGMAAEGDYGFVSGNAIDVEGDALLAPTFSGETQVYEGSGLLSWANPGSEAEVMATLADSSNQATIFAYSAGATLSNGTSAPAKRVGFFAHNDASPFSDEGLVLFDAAVNYALS